MEPILLLTHSGDFYTIDRVAAAIEARGREAVRLDTDRFPLDHTLEVRFAGARAARRAGARHKADPDPGPPVEVIVHADGRALDLARSPAIWARRLWPAARMPPLDPRFAAHAARMARTALLDALALVDGPLWVNPPAAGLLAESKLLQLRRATEVGLTVPDTLVTNDPGAARAFAEAAARDGAGGAPGEGAVTKLLLPLSQTMDGSGAFVYTTRLEAGDLAALESLRPAPQIFQPLVRAREELRVILVGERAFAGALVIEGRPAAARRVDWRRPSPGERARWEPRALDPALEGRLRALLARLGLVFGAVDLLVPEDGGEPAFLEVNPAGEWGWLERDLGLPIADAIAALLVEGRPAAPAGGSEPAP